MLAQELYARCDEDTRKVLQGYIVTMFEISNGDFYMKDVKNNFIDKKSSYDKIPFSEQMYIYLFYCTNLIDSNMRNLFKKYNVTIDDLFYLPNKDIDKKIVNYANNSFTSYYLEATFYNNPIAVPMILGMIDITKKVISIERIIYNWLMVDNTFYNDFVNSEFSRELNDLACQKEKYGKIRNNIEFNNGLSHKYMGIGDILNERMYNSEPAIGRDSELKEVITVLASMKKQPILVGDSGTGKTTIVDELVYKIQRGEVPSFLKDREIIELDTSDVVAGTIYRGSFEEKFKNIIDYANENDSILFIDEIHTIYGAGASSNDDNDMAGMLKKAIDRKNIRVIGTTTKYEYDKYFTSDALKRRFEPVIVNEPVKDALALITNKVFSDYSHEFSISLNTICDKIDEIIRCLIRATEKQCRTYKDKVNNPDLIISIIDKAFADARMNDEENLTIDNIIYAVNTCSRIYENSREHTINELKQLKPKVKSLTKGKIIKFPN